MEMAENWGKYASAGTRTRVQALATPGDNHYTTLACTLRILQGFKRLSAEVVEPLDPAGQEATKTVHGVVDVWQQQTVFTRARSIH